MITCVRDLHSQKRLCVLHSQLKFITKSIIQNSINSEMWRKKIVNFNYYCSIDKIWFNTCIKNVLAIVIALFHMVCTYYVLRNHSDLRCIKHRKRKYVDNTIKIKSQTKIESKKHSNKSYIPLKLKKKTFFFRNYFKIIRYVSSWSKKKKHFFGKYWIGGLICLKATLINWMSLCSFSMVVRFNIRIQFS